MSEKRKKIKPNRRTLILAALLAMLLVFGSVVFAADSSTDWAWVHHKADGKGNPVGEPVVSQNESRLYWKSVAEANGIPYYQYLFDYTRDASYVNIVEQNLSGDPITTEGITAPKTSFKEGETTFKVTEFIKTEGSSEELYVMSWNYSLPWVSEDVPHAAAINKSIQMFYDVEPEMRARESMERVKREYTIHWEVARKDGICALNIFETADGTYMTGTTVRSYYYDETAGQVLSRDEYLQKLGYSDEDLMDAFLAAEGKELLQESGDREKLKGHASKLQFYFTADGHQLKFAAARTSIHKLNGVLERLLYQTWQ